MTTLEVPIVEEKVPEPAPVDSAQTLVIAGLMAAFTGVVTLIMAALLIWSPDSVADLEVRGENEYSGFGTMLALFGALQLFAAYQAIKRRPLGRSLVMGIGALIVTLATFGLSGEGEAYRWAGVVLVAVAVGAATFVSWRNKDDISEQTAGIIGLVVGLVALVFFLFFSESRFFQVMGFVLLAAVVVAGVFVAAERALGDPRLAVAAAAVALVVYFLVGADATWSQFLGVGIAGLAIGLAYIAEPEEHLARSGGGLTEGWRVAFWFLLPSILGFVLFFFLPTIRAIGISFQDFPLLENEGTWIGWDNYREVLGDDLFYNAIWVTFKYVVINIGTQTVLALGIAVMMDRLTKSVFVRSILLLPWLLPNIMVGLLWLFMLDPRNGIINEWLGYFGIDSIGFLSNEDWAIPALSFINTWKFTGYTALLLFAGMQTVPGNLYEAAALDGASEWKMFTTITMPLLRPVLALVLVISLIGSFQVFDVVQAAAGGLQGNPGDPLDETRVLYLYIYDKAFVDGFGRRAGEGAAAATLLMLGLLVITVAQLRLSRAGESDLA
ncbi:MAG: sugar ABC transporter permease [Actinomycetota bacterium]